MSAFIVDRNHINYLVAAAETSRDFSYWDKNKGERVKVTRQNTDEVGQMLWNENIQSVASRYEGEDVSPAQLPGPIGEDYQFIFTDCVHLHFKPVQVFMSCRCLNYQSCEHEEWSDSVANEFLESLIIHYMRRLPGWDEAEWGAPEPQHKPGQIQRLIG